MGYTGVDVFICHDAFMYTEVPLKGWKETGQH